jgi:hypothetical protein
VVVTAAGAVSVAEAMYGVASGAANAAVKIQNLYFINVLLKK